MWEAPPNSPENFGATGRTALRGVHRQKNCTAFAVHTATEKNLKFSLKNAKKSMNKQFIELPKARKMLKTNVNFDCLKVSGENLVEHVFLDEVVVMRPTTTIN